MNSSGELRPNATLIPGLEAATDQWLAARDKYKMEPSDEYQSDYEVTLNDLGAAWGERYPEATDTPDAFEWPHCSRRRVAANASEAGRIRQCS